jgi:hypothetical protein
METLVRIKYSHRYGQLYTETNPIQRIFEGKIEFLFFSDISLTFRGKSAPDGFPAVNGQKIRK